MLTGLWYATYLWTPPLAIHLWIGCFLWLFLGVGVVHTPGFSY